MEKIRRCIFSPYRKGNGPTFTLTLFDLYKRDSMGKNMLDYELKQDRVILFKGEDYACSPMHAVDSDETVKSLMGFLTLRPGDTDREYFDSYTPEQLHYCQEHAEYLNSEVRSRFGED